MGFLKTVGTSVAWGVGQKLVNGGTDKASIAQAEAQTKLERDKFRADQASQANASLETKVESIATHMFSDNFEEIGRDIQGIMSLIQAEIPEKMNPFSSTDSATQEGSAKEKNVLSVLWRTGKPKIEEGLLKMQSLQAVEAKNSYLLPHIVKHYENLKIDRNRPFFPSCRVM